MSVAIKRVRIGQQLRSTSEIEDRPLGAWLCGALIENCRVPVFFIPFFKNLHDTLFSFLRTLAKHTPSIYQSHQSRNTKPFANS